MPCFGLPISASFTHRPVWCFTPPCSTDTLISSYVFPMLMRFKPPKACMTCSLVCALCFILFCFVLFISLAHTHTKCTRQCTYPAKKHWIVVDSFSLPCTSACFYYYYYRHRHHHHNNNHGYCSRLRSRCCHVLFFFFFCPFVDSSSYGFFLLFFLFSRF